MNLCVLSLLMGILFIPAHCEPGPCDEYQNITHPWRNRGYKSEWYANRNNDDGGLINKWWRFTGIGGDKIVTSCIGHNLGGTAYPVYTANTYTNVESQVQRMTVYGYVSSCPGTSFSLDVVLCPGGFYVYKPLSHPHSSMGYVTYHQVCNKDSCGPLATCSSGACACVSGYKVPPNIVPVDTFGCVDIDECTTSTPCGSNSNCNNTAGSYNCSCLTGFVATNVAVAPGSSNPCIDIDECLETSPKVCGDNGACTNNAGSYVCTCNDGYVLVPDSPLVCEDIDECFNSTVCGPDSECLNTPGSYTCKCQPGYESTDPDADPSEDNICIDIDECDLIPPFCGPNANCSNTIGAHICICDTGYREIDDSLIASVSNPCTDIDECFEQPGLCGERTVCTNTPGAFVCSCYDGFFPSTGILWKLGISKCRSLDDILDAIIPAEGQTKERAFLDNMDDQLKNNSDVTLPPETVTNSFAAAMEVSGVGARARSQSRKVGSEGDGETGTVVLGISDRLVGAMVASSQNQTKRKVTTPTVDINLETIGPGSKSDNETLLSAKGNMMEINMQSLAKNNNGTASVAFLTLNGMESLLSHQYFKTENQTEMYSDVITAFLPKTNHTNLTEPVNFTIEHKKKLSDSGVVTCVYWEDKTEQQVYWSIEGCWVVYTTENYTKCSCSHLSTFALILQTGEPPPENPFLDWLNRMCVMVGLFFFALAVLTFLLCSWNPKINNTARLHLCLSLGLFHLLMLWNDKYAEHERACAGMAGLIHFLILASFVWMLLEALQLYLLVRSLTKVQVIQRDGLPRPLLYLVGYGVPLVIVGVSALIYSDGYGAVNEKACLLKQDRGFNWALIGPVITILALNFMLFGATLWSLRLTLANMKSDVSQSTDTKLIIFKIVAQFVILGCTWILGFYQTNIFFQVLFIVLNSQQGTFLFIVHCVLNKEVREEYIKLLHCYSKDKAETDVKDAASDDEKDD